MLTNTKYSFCSIAKLNDKNTSTDVFFVKFRLYLRQQNRVRLVLKQLLLRFVAIARLGVNFVK